MRKQTGITLAALAMALAMGNQAARAAVDLNLVLLVDVSGSVDATEYDLQKTGYVLAFQSAAVQAAIASHPGGIGVTYAEWSGVGEFNQVVGWTTLTDATTADAFATAISNVSRSYNGNTALQDALTSGANLFATAPMLDANGREVIDISGDGARNAGSTGTTGRDYALNTIGVNTINGLVILGEVGVQQYYQDSVIGGASPQLYVATSFTDFATAAETKIGTEITGNVPEPASLLVWSLLGGAAAICVKLRGRKAIA